VATIHQLHLVAAGDGMVIRRRRSSRSSLPAHARRGAGVGSV